MRVLRALHNLALCVFGLSLLVFSGPALEYALAQIPGLDDGIPNASYESGLGETNPSFGETSRSSNSLMPSEPGPQVPVERESTFVHSSDYHKAHGVMLRSVPVLSAFSANIYTSAFSVLMSSIGLTDSTLLSAFSKASQEAHFGGEGTFAQLNSYIRSLEQLPDKRQRFEELSACITKELGDSSLPSSYMDAVKKCTGGFSIGIPQVSTTTSSNANSQAKPEQLQEIPNSVSIETTLRNGGSSFDPDCWGVHLSGVALQNAEPECYQRSIWSYIFYDVGIHTRLPVPLPNKERWMLEDEARLHFGNLLISERNAALDDVDEVRVGSESSVRFKAEKSFDPPYKVVNFWTPNTQTPVPLIGGVTGPSPSSQGIKVPLKGLDLLRAKYLQDIYGTIYSLAYKMCQHDNAQNEWARHKQGGGWSLACPLWSMEANATWSTSTGVNIPGLTSSATVFACTRNPPVGPPLPAPFGDYLPDSPRYYQKLWPDGTPDLDNSVSAGGALWDQKRFYQIRSAGQSNPAAPKIRDLRENISVGNISFTEQDAKNLNDLLRYEFPPALNGVRNCTDFLENVALGDVMSFEGPFTTSVTILGATLPLFTAHTIADPGWPYKPELERENKRIALLYEYANLAAGIRAFEFIERYLANLKARSTRTRERWPEIFSMAENMVTRNFPGEGIEQIAARKEGLQEALASKLYDIRAFYTEQKSVARFTARKKLNPSAGASTKGVD